MIASCRNGISSCEIARTVGCCQTSAWHLIYRVRHILSQENAGLFGTGGGVTEADWTYVGGLVEFMPHERRERTKAARHKGKAIVHAIKERRSGQVRARMIPHPRRGPVEEHLLDNVATGARLYTDDSRTYWYSGGWYQHRAVNHSRKEYVRGTVHVNGCENFFNCLRRTLKGSYIRPSPKHPQSYVDEQAFRFNVRKEGEWDRFAIALRLILGKRLTYKTLTGGATR